MADSPDLDRLVAQSQILMDTDDPVIRAVASAIPALVARVRELEAAGFSASADAERERQHAEQAEAKSEIDAAHFADALADANYQKDLRVKAEAAFDREYDRSATKLAAVEAAHEKTYAELQRAEAERDEARQTSEKWRHEWYVAHQERDAVIERCAQVAEERMKNAYADHPLDNGYRLACQHVAAAIRALRSDQKKKGESD